MENNYLQQSWQEVFLKNIFGSVQYYFNLALKPGAAALVVPTYNRPLFLCEFNVSETESYKASQILHCTVLLFLEWFLL